MADQKDIAEIDPVLELTFGPCSLACTGRLDRSTRRHALEAVEVVLAGKPPSVEIDVSGLEVADTDGANTLVAIQRTVREAGVDLRWRGFDQQHVTRSAPVRGIVTWNCPDPQPSGRLKVRSGGAS